jgi:ATP-dependent Clp protease protease subunit
MQYVSPDVATICIGMAASMSCVLLAGTKEKSCIETCPDHDASRNGAIGGQASDIEITVNEIRKLKAELYDIVHNHSGRSVSQIEQDFDRDKWMTAIEAKEYGLVDEVLLTNVRKQKKKAKRTKRRKRNCGEDGANRYIENNKGLKIEKTKNR